MSDPEGFDYIRVKCPECGSVLLTHDIGDECACDDCGELFRRFDNIVGWPPEGEDAPREIVCLIGSRHQDRQFLSEKEDLTLEGCVVFSPGVYGPTDSDELDAIHREKIRLADRVHVVTDETDLDRETSAQIAFARRHGKTITYRSGRDPVQ